MRKVILSMMVSLDGLIAGPNGDLEWFLTDEKLEQEMLGVLRSVDLMIFGRVAYELLAQYWPTGGTAASGEAPGGFTSKESEIEFARLMNSIPKMVFSKTLKKADWGPVTIAREVRADEIGRLKRQPGKDIVVFAGADIASAFTRLDLFDEYRLMVHPIVVGRGTPLFKGLSNTLALKLKKTTTTPSGIVILQHDRHAAAWQEEVMAKVIVGIESAIAQAKAAAGDKAVTVVGGVSVIQQLLNAGLCDELRLDIMPIFLGAGLRFVEGRSLSRVRLEKIGTQEVGERTSLRFRVWK